MIKCKLGAYDNIRGGVVPGYGGGATAVTTASGGSAGAGTAMRVRDAGQWGVGVARAKAGARASPGGARGGKAAGGEGTVDLCRRLGGGRHHVGVATTAAARGATNGGGEVGAAPETSGGHIEQAHGHGHWGGGPRVGGRSEAARAAAGATSTMARCAASGALGRDMTVSIYS